jgi:energy-coupling factor transport system ATP-binding protein
MEQAGLDFDLYRDRLTATLSGGERRRAGLASVLAMRPQILLLDEPTAGLDPVMRADVLNRLRRLHREGTTIVLVTHNMDDVALLAHRVYVLHKGQVTSSGTTCQVFRHRQHLVDIGLDVPVFTSIADQLRQHGIDLGPDILTLDQAKRAIVRVLGADEETDERV